MKKAKIVGIIAIVITTVIVGRMVWQVDDWGRDWTVNTADLPATSLDSEPNELVDQIKQWAKNERRWTVETIDNKTGTTNIHLTRRTLIMRYVDDVRIQIQPSETGSVLSANSTSRLGKGDLGQNPRNLRELKRALGV